MISESPKPERPLTGRAVQRRKLRVDEVHRLDLADLRRAGFFQRPAGVIWSSRWSWGFAVEPTSVVYFARVDGAEGCPLAVVLGHPKTVESGWDDPIAYPVPLEWTACHFGGARPWFRCALVTDGRLCNRRSRIIFKPHGSPYFACRECWRLSYRSRQVHRNVLYEGFDRLLAAADALDRVSDPRCGVRRRARALRRARRAEPAIAAMKVGLARLEKMALPPEEAAEALAAGEIACEAREDHKRHLADPRQGDQLDEEGLT